MKNYHQKTKKRSQKNVLDNDLHQNYGFHIFGKKYKPLQLQREPPNRMGAGWRRDLKIAWDAVNGQKKVYQQTLDKSEIVWVAINMWYFSLKTLAENIA